MKKTLFCNSTIITRDTLIYNRSLFFEFILDDIKDIVSGLVLNSENIPIEGACIEVYKEICNDKKHLLGHTFSNSFGEFNFTLNINPSSKYTFFIYSPL